MKMFSFNHKYQFTLTTSYNYRRMYGISPNNLHTYVMSLFASLCILKPATYTECIKKTEQIGNRSQICKAADVVKFLV